MVDTSATALVLTKSTAHKDLAESLRQRDGGAYFHLCMGEHLTELQHRYEDALAGGYTRQELRRWRSDRLRHLVHTCESKVWKLRGMLYHCLGHGKVKYGGTGGYALYSAHPLQDFYDPSFS